MMKSIFAGLVSRRGLFLTLLSLLDLSLPQLVQAQPKPDEVVRVQETAKEKSKIPSAGEVLPQSSEKLRKLMHNFLERLQEIKGLVVDPKAFADKKNEKAILTWLSRLSKDLQSGQNSQILSSSRYQVTLDVFRQHLVDTQSAFRAGNKEQAHAMLGATGSLCISCHTQVSSPVTQVQSASMSQAKLSSLSPAKKLLEAEYFFISHQYLAALVLYNQIIRDYEPKNLRVDELNRALRRKLMILVKVQQDPRKAMESFSQDLLNKDLPIFARKNIEAWLVYLKAWSLEKLPVDKMSDDKFISFAQEKLSRSTSDRAIAVSDPHVVNYLRFSGMLYRRMHARPESSEYGKMLLLLARCERFLNNEFFYSLSDLYLKQCIRRYGAVDIGRECYKELEAGVQYAYTGTTGLEIPPAVQLEMDQLKKYLAPGGRLQKSIGNKDD